MQKPETMKGYSLVAAMRMAIAYSHKTEDEIAAGMGWSAASASRFFSSGDYSALPNIPRLCRVLENTIILQWLIDNTETDVQPQEPVDAPAMLRSLGGLFGKMGAIARDGQETIADGVVDTAEARRMIRRVQALLAEGELLLAGLQANVERG